MKVEPSSSRIENKAFTSALSKIVSASSSHVHDAIQAAKATKPSRHTRFVYDPAKGREPSR